MALIKTLACWQDEENEGINYEKRYMKLTRQVFVAECEGGNEDEEDPFFCSCHDAV